MVNLRRQYLPLADEIMAGMAEVVAQSDFINGKPVRQFCDALARQLQANHVLPCANGTDALLIALMALDLSEGDEVILPTLTFVATVESVALLGLVPVFADVDPLTFTIDPQHVAHLITPRTRCIIPVHLYGQCADMSPLLALAQQHGLYIIEDNAQAIDAEYYFADGRSQKAGTIGHIATTSFYPSKNLGAYGDSGALFTQNDELAQKIAQIANHGQVVKYRSERIGVNSRMDSFQAVVLLAKLKRLDVYTAARRWAAAQYDKHLVSCSQLIVPQRAAYSSHVFHQYTLLLKGDRDNFRAKLKEAGIPTLVYYPILCHLQPPYRHFGKGEGSLPSAEFVVQRIVSLPMHSELTSREILYIAQHVLAAVEQD